MTRLRCASENEVASPVVPSTLSPSQPLSSRKRASFVARGMSGSPAASTGVAIAAITPRSADSGIVLLLYESAADVERGEARHADELGIGRRQPDDLHRPVEPDQQRPDHG